MKAKLMSYNQVDFRSKAHMQMRIADIEKNVEKYQKELKEVGLVEYILTQVWTEQGKFRLGHYFSYRVKKHLSPARKY